MFHFPKCSSFPLLKMAEARFWGLVTQAISQEHLVAIVAKPALLGQEVVIVRCEGIDFAGNCYRNKLK